MTGCMLIVFVVLYCVTHQLFRDHKYLDGFDKAMLFMAGIACLAAICWDALHVGL